MSCDFKAKPIGEGSFGKAFAATLVSQNNANIVIKLAKVEAGAMAERDVKHEYYTLTEIHADGHVRGIQSPPHLFVDLRTQGIGIGHVTSTYDFSLQEVVDKKQNLSEEQGLQCCEDLVSGLAYLHSHQRVHGDIKPSNTCLENEEFALADFGGARTNDGIDLNHPLGVITDEFTAREDIDQARDISRQYQLHLIASGQVTDPIQVISILGDVYRDGNTPQDLKEEIKPLLQYLFSQQMDNADYEFWLKDGKDQSADEKILSSLVYPLGFDQPQEKILDRPHVDLSAHVLLEQDIAKLKESSVLLNQQHDVYSLGLTLLKVLAPASGSREDKIHLISQKYGNNMAEMFRRMCSENPDERPTIAEVQGLFDLKKPRGET
jgi:serine/threonine protein kinase